VFGMGTGVSPPPKSPNVRNYTFSECGVAGREGS
jgi:hypothetical protein